MKEANDRKCVCSKVMAGKKSEERKIEIKVGRNLFNSSLHIKLKLLRMSKKKGTKVAPSSHTVEGTPSASVAIQRERRMRVSEQH